MPKMVQKGLFLPKIAYFALKNSPFLALKKGLNPVLGAIFSLLRCEPAWLGQKSLKSTEIPLPGEGDKPCHNPI